MPHILPIQTRFSDYDMQGHVYNGAFLAYMDLGKTHYFTDRAADLWDWQHISLVVAHVEVDYLAPAMPSDPLEVMTVVESIGDTSLHLLQEVRRAGDSGMAYCRARTVMVNLDLDAGSPAHIPAEWRQRLMPRS